MDVTQCINFLLTRAQHAVLGYFRSKLDEFEVTPVQYGILSCLWGKDGQIATEIAQKLSLDGSTITGILDRMESRGLLKRQPDPTDRRAIRVVLSDKGRELEKPLGEVVKISNQEVFQEDEAGTQTQ
jgi:DNA-binding MarR family transcriptional regulator